MAQNLNNYLDFLNIQQRDAVKNTEGALLVFLSNKTLETLWPKGNKKICF